MHKTTKHSTNPCGFTLIEIVLVMAILLILLSVVYATFFIVNSSHAQVAVINDAKDFAYLNMAVIEKNIVNANDIILSNTFTEFGYTSLYFNTDGILMSSDVTDPDFPFQYPQYKVSTASGTQRNKWGVTATYSKNTDKTLKVNLQIIDNATGSVYYTLDKDIVLLNIADTTKITGTSGAVVKYKDFEAPTPTP